MFEKITDLYTYAMEHGADPRVKDKFLMSSPFPTWAIVAVYLIIATKIGPKLMEHRKPFEFRNVLLAYNAFQVVGSTYLVYVNMSVGWTTHYSLFKCQDIDFSTTDPQALLGVYATHCYFLFKFTEFCDTLFFILRKKKNQISFLHLFHHSVVPVFAWICVKFFPGGSITMGMAVNSFVHVVMYTYYLLAGLGPQMQPYLWWKKYLTSMQLIQFVLAMFHLLIIIFGDCNTLCKPMALIGFLIIVALYILFNNFYNQAYVKKENNEKIQFVIGMFHILIAIFGECKTLYRPMAIIGFFFAAALYFLFKNFYNQSYVKKDE